MAGVFRKIGFILTGYYVLIFKSETEEIRRKRKICSTCQFRKYFVCGECGCVISAKTASDDECPKGFW